MIVWFISLVLVAAFSFNSQQALASPSSCKLSARIACKASYKQAQRNCRTVYRNKRRNCRTIRRTFVKQCNTQRLKSRCKPGLTAEQKASCRSSRQTQMATCMKEKGGMAPCTPTYKTCRLTCFKSCKTCTLRQVSRCIRRCYRTRRNCQRRNRGLLRTCRRPALKWERQCRRNHRLLQWQGYYKCLSHRRSAYLTCVYQAHDQERECKTKTIKTYRVCRLESQQQRSNCRDNVSKKCG